MTFINKMDREGRDPFELLDEIAEDLQLETAPLVWPVGMGLNFRGLLDLYSGEFLALGDGARTRVQALTETLSPEEVAKLDEEAELVRDGLPRFSSVAYRQGHQTPVFFGCALKNFGVRELLTALAREAPQPRPAAAKDQIVAPSAKDVSGFVFKVQANMDPNHRDRVAFMRIASGQFRRGMKLKQSGTSKQLGIHNPIFFFAQERETLDEAWPGDIIGIPNHGVLRVGDSLSESGSVVFTGIPNFAPELLRRVRLADPMKQKHLTRALESLAEEGVTQVFKPVIGTQWIVGVVGPLQLDVLKSRLAEEYGLEADLEASPFDAARWISGEKADLEEFLAAYRGQTASDRDGAPVFMAKNNWELGYVAEKYPRIAFARTRERHEVHVGA